MTYKYLLVDFADTIAELKPSREELIQRYTKEATGLSIDTSKIRRIARTLDLIQPYSSVKTQSSIEKRDFYINYNTNLLTALGVSHLGCRGIQLYEYFMSSSSHWTPKKDAQRVLVRLKEEGMGISVLSNFDGNLLDIINVAGFDMDIFSNIFISQVIGLEKPNPAFLAYAMEKQKWSTSETLSIGDSYKLDFIPARENGVDGIILDETNEYEHLEIALKDWNSIGDFLLRQKKWL